MNEDLIKMRKLASARFIRSCVIRAQLNAVDEPVECCETSGTVNLSRPQPFHPFAEVGQVRLLSQTEGLTYVLLADTWDENSFLVIPFSAYSDPATDLELRIRHDFGGHLEVLQVWNARSLCRSSLAKSWLVGKIDEQDRQDALSLWRHSIGGEELSDKIAERTGVPITSPDDVRLDYQDAELKKFAKLDRQDLDSVERAGEEVEDAVNPDWGRFRPIVGNGAFTRPEEGVYELAAATPKTFSGFCPIVGRDIRVYVRFDSQKRSLCLRVYDAADNRSGELDGWNVLDSSGMVIGTVVDSGFTMDCEAAFDGVVLLLDYDGQIHQLEIH